MADTVVAGAQMADTDYRYQGMTDRFIDRMESMADSFTNLMARAMGIETVVLQGMATVHSQWMAGWSQIQPAITASAVNRLGASDTDEVIGLLKEGLALANSASPPVPGYQNLGTVGPGQGSGPSGIMLPKGSTVTIPAT